MKRRGFLGALGAVVFAPKALPKGVKPANLTALDIPGISLGPLGREAPPPGVGVLGHTTKMEWATRRLKEIFGLNKHEEDYKIRNFYINGMDEDTAALKSMSVNAKMRRTRRVQYFKSRRENETFLNGIMGGMFKDDY